MEKQLKKWLKKLKISEPTISAILGGLLIITVAYFSLNYFKNQNQAQNGEILTAEQQTANDKENEGLLGTHQVQEGQSLWDISIKYYQNGDNWIDIAKANNLSNPDIIEPGQELKLPKITAVNPNENSGQEASETVSNPGQGNAPITNNTYQVQEGDDLWSIAVRSYGDGYKWTEIAKANNLVNPDLIDVGQTLTLPR